MKNKTFAVWINTSGIKINYGQTGEVTKDTGSVHWLFQPHGSKDKFLAVEHWDCIITNKR